MLSRSSTLEYLITVGYGITVLGGHLLQKNKRMVWNNRIGWKKSQKIIKVWGGIIVYWVEKIAKDNKGMGWNNGVLGKSQ